MRVIHRTAIALAVAAITSCETTTEIGPSGRENIGKPPVPATPTNLSAVGGDGQIVISFTKSENSGYYSAQCKPAGGNTTFKEGVSSPITVTGLTNGVEYSCILYGVNSTGGSKAAGPVTATPSATPGPIQR